MKNIALCLVVLLLISCSPKEKSKGFDKIPSTKKETAAVQTDSMVFVNNCSSNSFISSLEENTKVEDHAFILTIASKDGKMRKVDTLDVRPSLSHIEYCTEDYVVVGFACGGPCYSQVFIFTQEDRPNEQFTYSQRVYANPNIITHIENEEFEKLIVHNLKNGKELKVFLEDSDLLSYGHMDTLFMIKNKLVMEYTNVKDQLKKRVVNLESILK